MSRDMHPVTLDLLNDYILQDIVKYLPLRERVAYERVSRRVSQALDTAWKQQTSIAFCDRIYDLPFTDTIDQKCEHRQHWVEQSDIVRLPKKLPLPFIRKVLSKCTNLKSLEIALRFKQIITDEELTALVQSCPKLEHLHLELYGDQHWLTLSCLKALNFAKVKCFIYKLKDYYHEAINIPDPDGTEENIISFLNQAESLEHFEKSPITQAQLDALLQKSNRQQIRFALVNDIHQEELNLNCFDGSQCPIIKALPNLVLFHHTAYGSTFNCLDDWPRHLYAYTNLRHLSISDSVLPNELTAFIKSKCENLRSLTYLDDLTDEEFPHFKTIQETAHDLTSLTIHPDSLLMIQDMSFERLREFELIAMFDSDRNVFDRLKTKEYINAFENFINRQPKLRNLIFFGAFDCYGISGCYDLYDIVFSYVPNEYYDLLVSYALKHPKRQMKASMGINRDLLDMVAPSPALSIYFQRQCFHEPYLHDEEEIFKEPIDYEMIQRRQRASGANDDSICCCSDHQRRHLGYHSSSDDE